MSMNPTSPLDEPARNKRTAKRILAIGLPLVLIVGAGISYAYWTAPGTGTGTAATANGIAVTVTTDTAAFPLAGLAPGVAPKTIGVQVNNPAAAGGPTAHVTKVSVTIASVTGGTPAAGCTAADYAISGSPMTVPAASQDIPAGSSASVSGATIAFANSASNQDACKGATVNLAYSAT